MVRPFDKLMVLSIVEAQTHHKSVIRYFLLVTFKVKFSTPVTTTFSPFSII